MSLSRVSSSKPASRPFLVFGGPLAGGQERNSLPRPLSPFRLGRKYGFEDAEALRRPPSEASSQGSASCESSSGEEEQSQDARDADGEKEAARENPRPQESRRPRGLQRRAASAAAVGTLNSQAEIKGEAEEAQVAGEELEEDFVSSVFAAQEKEDEELDAEVESSDDGQVPDEALLKRDAEAPLEDLLKSAKQPWLLKSFSQMAVFASLFNCLLL